MKKTILAMVLSTFAITGCSKGGNSPVAPEAFGPSVSPVTEAAEGGAVSASSVGGPKLKNNVSVTIEGSVVVGEIRTIYNEDLGQVAMLVFNFAHNRYLGGTLEFVSGPVGKVTTFRFDVGRYECGTKLQVDFVRAPNGITQAMQSNQIWHGDFIDAEFPTLGDCPGPKPSPSPSPDPCDQEILSEECLPPPTDVCPNVEGIQTELPDGYYITEGGCYPIPEPTCETDESLCPPPPPVDVCPNIEGLQETVPEGYELTEQGCTLIPPPPPVGACFYNISGSFLCKVKPAKKNELAEDCTDPGEYTTYEAACVGAAGLAANWDNNLNHCAVPFPGISHDKFQLTPGQSNDCLSKHDD